MMTAPKPFRVAKAKVIDPKKCAAPSCPDLAKPTPIPDSEQAWKWTLSLCDFHKRILQDDNKLRLAREKGIKGSIDHADHQRI
jgi:hypothetical protein